MPSGSHPDPAGGKEGGLGKGRGLESAPGVAQVVADGKGPEAGLRRKRAWGAEVPFLTSLLLSVGQNTGCPLPG